MSENTIEEMMVYLGLTEIYELEKKILEIYQTSSGDIREHIELIKQDIELEKQLYKLYIDKLKEIEQDIEFKKDMEYDYSWRLASIKRAEKEKDMTIQEKLYKYGV